MIPKEDQERIKNQIMELMDSGNNISTICTLLNINKRTFYRYKKKIIREVIRDYKPQKTDLEYSRAEVKKSLEDCYNANKRIMDNPKSSPQAVSVASEMIVIAKMQIAKLIERGYITPQLPIRQTISLIPHEVLPIEGKEIKSS